MLHLMHDLETLSLKPDAVLVSLGAALFDRDGVKFTFYQPISLYQPNRHIDVKTIQWWMNQEEAARKVFNQATQSLSQVLALYDIWLRAHNFTDGGVWANGSDFDNVLLTNAHEYCGMPMPWKFYQHRCYRTIKSLYPEVKIARFGIHHHAEEDAVYQASHLIEIAKVTGLPL